MQYLFISITFFFVSVVQVGPFSYERYIVWENIAIIDIIE